MGIPIRILIVEDSPDDADLVLRHLRQAGYDPVSQRVQTPEEMKTALESEPWDLVVSDYLMPRFDSLTALNLLNQSGRDVPFIVVSGSIGEDIAVAMMKAGAHDYVLKQNLARFVSAVQRELREAANRRQQKLTEQAKRQLQIERDEHPHRRRLRRVPEHCRTALEWSAAGRDGQRCRRRCSRPGAGDEHAAGPGVDGHGDAQADRPAGTRKSRAGFPDVRVILITLHHSEELKALSVAAGAERLILKRSLRHELPGAIAQLFPGRAEGAEQRRP